MARHSRTGVRGLYRDADGRFRIDLRWRDPATGKWKRHCEKLPVAATAAAAKLRARDILAAALAGQFEPNREKPRRLHTSLDEYLEWARVNRPKTYRDRNVSAKTLKTTLGDPLLEELSPFDLERFKKTRTKSGVAPATVNRAIAMLKHFYGLAASWGWVNGEHARSIREVKLLREPPGRVRYLHENEEQRLFAAIPIGIRPIVATALLSGMRLSEIVRLRKGAIDFRSRIITLEHTKSSRVRRIPINDPLASTLQEAIARSKNEYVFVNSTGKPYSIYGVSGMFRKAMQKANITRDARVSPKSAMILIKKFPRKRTFNRKCK